MSRYSEAMTGKNPPVMKRKKNEVCHVCSRPQSFFEVRGKNY